VTDAIDAELDHQRVVLLMALARANKARVYSALRRIARLRGEMRQGCK
jgi:hypothetical protein